MASVSPRSGQQPGQPFGQHGLAGTRRAGEEQVVGARRQPPPGHVAPLPGPRRRTCPARSRDGFGVRAGARLVLRVRNRGQVPGGPRRSRRRAEPGSCSPGPVRRGRAPPQRRWPGRRRRPGSPAWTAAITAGRTPRTGRSLPSRPSSAMKTVRPVGLMSSAARSAGHGNREVESGAALGQGRGDEVGRDLPPAQRNPGVLGSRTDSFLGFVEGRVRQAQDDEGRQSLADVGLDLHDVAVQPHQGHANTFAPGPPTPPP